MFTFMFALSLVLTLLPLTTSTQTVQRASSFITLDFPLLIPESIEYDPIRDQILVGSLGKSGIHVFPNAPQAMTMTADDSILRFQNSSTPYPFAGIQLDSEKRFIYAAVGSTSGEKPAGVYMFPLDDPNDAGKMMIDLASLRDVNLGILINDVVRVGESLFVTDFFGYQIIRIDLAKNNAYSVIFSYTKYPILCSVCSKSGFDGPNGIEAVGDIVLVARSSTSTPALLKFMASNPSELTEVRIYPSTTLIRGADAIYFDASKEILYVTCNGFNRIVALRALDSAWNSAVVIASYDAGCRYGDPSASFVIPSSGDLVTLCTENFGEGPYHLNRVPAVGNNFAAGNSNYYELVNDNQVPDGTIFDRKTRSVYYSSYYRGGVYSSQLPVATATGAKYSSSRGDLLRVIGPEGVTATLGLALDPSNSDWIWIATSRGVVKASFKTGAKEGDEIAIGGPTSLRDLDVDNSGNVYVTDILGGKVWEVIRGTTEPRVLQSNLCVNICDGNGPNGIRLVPGTNLLLTGTYGDALTSVLFSINLANLRLKQLEIGPSGGTGYLNGINSMIFDADGEFLFVNSYKSNQVTALYSCDGWANTANASMVFSTGCPFAATSLTYTDTGDLLVTCTDSEVKAAGPGPYRISRITGIRARILGVSFSSAAQLCPGYESNDSDPNNGPLVVGVVSVILAIFVMSFLYTYKEAICKYGDQK